MLSGNRSMRPESRESGVRFSMTPFRHIHPVIDGRPSELVGGPLCYASLLSLSRPPPRYLDYLRRSPSSRRVHPGSKRKDTLLGRRSGGLRRFRRQMTHRDLTGRPPFLRFDPIRLQAKHDRKKPIGTIGAQSVARAPCGDERTPVAVSEDDIRGLRRFGESHQPLSDLVDAEVVSRHLGITPRRVLSMARKGSIPCVRISAKTIRFDIEAVDRALGRR